MMNIKQQIMALPAVERVALAVAVHPTATDLWLAMVVLLWAFDKPVRWYVWVMLVSEFALGQLAITRAAKGVKCSSTGR